MIAKFTAGAERGQLQFKESVVREFSFLELNFGFHMTQQELTYVRYESDQLFLNIYHGRGSYEVGVELGKLSTPEVHYRLPSLVSALAPDCDLRTEFQASSRESVETSVAEIASIVRRYCAEALRADEKTLRLVEEEARAESERLTHWAQFGAILRRADQAWEAKDMRRARKLYQEAETALDEPRARRLRYLKGKEELIE